MRRGLARSCDHMQRRGGDRCGQGPLAIHGWHTSPGLRAADHSIFFFWSWCCPRIPHSCTGQGLVTEVTGTLAAEKGVLLVLVQKAKVTVNFCITKQSGRDCNGLTLTGSGLGCGGLPGTSKVVYSLCQSQEEAFSFAGQFSITPKQPWAVWRLLE